MLQNIFGLIVLLIISVVTVFMVYVLTRKSLQHLLNEIIKFPSGTIFYLRLFSIGLFFIALSAVLEINFDLKVNSPFMEYVWKVASGLSSVFRNTSLFLLGYLTLITILVAVLRNKHE